MSGMRLQLLHSPPIGLVDLSWRELYEREAFAQREMVGESRLRGVTKERDVSLGIGSKALEELDLAGAVRPVAFAEEGYMTGFSSPAHPSDLMRFKDESEPRPWKEYEWESEMEPQFPQVTPLYSPWQLLYLDDAVKGTYRELSLEILAAKRQEREEKLDGLNKWSENEYASWRSIDQRWDSLVKLLVAIQNRYWPEITDRIALIPDLQGDGYLSAGPDAKAVPAARTLEGLGLSVEEVLASYYFLVERGLDRDPRDGLTLLRRARPRAFHLRWRGLPRRAQDNFDGAELLRRFLVDLTGENPPHPDSWPIDGRQDERAAIYERGPGGPWSSKEIKEELLAAELYPHGVHLIGEGASEWIVASRLIEALFGSRAVGEIEFLDLGGSGGASYVGPLSKALGDYAIRAVVIVDREGQMADYLRSAINRGEISEEDVLLFEDSLEASNASAQELIDLVRRIADSLEVEPASVAFDLDGNEMDEIHRERKERSSGRGKGLAEDLLAEIRKRTKGRLDIDKVVLADALAECLVEEVKTCAPEDLDTLKRERPIVGFVIDRVASALNRPRPAGSQP